MIIRPQQKLKDILFYNKILGILCLFSILCFVTSFVLQYQTVSYKVLPGYITSPTENMIWGPIKVDNKAKIYKITAYHSGKNSANYLTGEVLDEDKETLYEFGKDMWHESGYDSDGYWVESDNEMFAYLTFKEKGTYYIRFSSDNILDTLDDGTIILRNGRTITSQDKAPKIENMSIYIFQMKNSYVPHAKVGTIILIITMIVFYLLNRRWVNDALAIINEKLEEMND